VFKIRQISSRSLRSKFLALYAKNLQAIRQGTIRHARQLIMRSDKPCC